jgi:nitroreductase/NAD-dependent dihydropyrimidine dehydrogenase PreA subunit
MLMPLFTVNDTRCVRCGLCAEACPALIVRRPAQETLPAPIDGTEGSCIGCGHCVAVCPTAALSHRLMSPEDCPPLREEWRLSPEGAEHFLRSRRSIRSYRDRPVERATLEKLIDIAAHAPTGHNSQTVQWHIVFDGDRVRALAGLVVDWMRDTERNAPAMAKAMNLERVIAAWGKGIDRVCRSAPHLILAHAHQKDRFAPLSVPIALAYLELSAPSFDLGTCWAGYFTAAARSWEPLGEALALPEGHQAFGVLMVGHPRFSYRRFPRRRSPQLSWS